MKIQTTVLCLILIFIVGCANSPSVTCTSLEGKDAYVASLAKHPYFTIITDGDISGGVSNTIFIGAKYKGKIVPSGGDKAVSFTVKGDRIEIDDQAFGFNKGCVFLISVKDKLEIKLMYFTEIDKLHSLVASDQKIVTFFK